MGVTVVSMVPVFVAMVVVLVIMCHRTMSCLATACCDLSFRETFS